METISTTNVGDVESSPKADWSKISEHYPELAKLLGEVSDGRAILGEKVEILMLASQEEGETICSVTRCEYSETIGSTGRPKIDNECTILISTDGSVEVISRWISGVGGYERNNNMLSQPKDAKAALTVATSLLEAARRIQSESPEKFIPASQE